MSLRVNQKVYVAWNFNCIVETGGHSPFHALQYVVSQKWYIVQDAGIVVTEQ